MNTCIKFDWLESFHMGSENSRCLVYSYPFLSLFLSPSFLAMAKMTREPQLGLALSYMNPTLTNLVMAVKWN